MSLRVAINGFGRIGRKVMRLSLLRDDVDVVAVNDLGSASTSAHLFQYDSVHGPLSASVELADNGMEVDGQFVRFFSERDPASIPWKSLGVDIVLECTGVFTAREKAAAHLQAGASKVIISAPSKDADQTICMGINESDYDPSKHHVISNASCTTNALAPVAQVLDENFGIRRGLMTTIHSYTNDQKILDLPHTDLRRTRAAALNMIPTSTGAAKAIGQVLPRLKGKLNGFAIRVPTPNVSVLDLTVELEKATSVEAINKAMELASKNRKGILRYSHAPLVSSDYNGDTHSSCFDALSTQVVDQNLVKVLSWYDNETGYSARLLDLATFLRK